MLAPAVECRCPECGSRCHFQESNGWQDLDEWWVHRHDDGTDYNGEFMLTTEAKKRFGKEES